MNFQDCNRKTLAQLVSIIMLDCIQQCNDAKLPRDEYEIKLRTLLRARLGQDYDAATLIDAVIHA